MSYYEAWNRQNSEVIKRIPELPFSNIWVAQNTIDKIPTGSVLYVGILNSLRSWNFFMSQQELIGYANTGGFGIDGGISSLLGASLANPDTLYFGVVGDLSFFYDMNAIGNRHVGNNLRIMVVNNGKGIEFRNYHNPGSQFGDETDLYISAAGHFGKQSRKLLKHYAEDLGFEYLSSENKEQYWSVIERFVSDKMSQPMILEIFTDGIEESNALKIMRNLVTCHYKKEEDVYQIMGKGQIKRIGMYAMSKAARHIIKMADNMPQLEGIELFLYDANESIQGSFVGNHEVLSPKGMKEHCLERLIIASDLYFEEVYEEYKYMENLGVEIRGISDI